MKTRFRPFQRFATVARACVALGTAATLLAACTTSQPVTSADLPRLGALVEVNDTVTCTLRDGSTKTIKVSAVEPDALVGENHQRIALADITQAEITRTDVTKSVLLGLAVAAGVAAAAVAGGGGGGMGGGGY